MSNVKEKDIRLYDRVRENSPEVRASALRHVIRHCGVDTELIQMLGLSDLWESQLAS